MATSPAHDHPEASPPRPKKPLHAYVPIGEAAWGQRPKKPVNWGRIAGLGLLAVLSPFILSILAMVLWSIQAEDESRRRRARTPAASERVCYEVAPAVVARIEAGLAIPGGRLRGVRAVHSAEDPEQWFIAADVQGVGYEGERDIALWRLTTRGDPSTGAGAPEAAIATKDGLADDDHALTTGNGLAGQVSNFPFGYGIDRPDLQAAARACPTPVLAGG